MRVALMLASVLLVSSCAGIEVARVADQTGDKGLRFYRPEPYLLVTNAGGEMSASLVWLPNMNEEYVVRQTGWIGKSELDVKLDQGWNLTSLGITREEKVSELVTSLTGAVGGLREKAIDLVPGEAPPTLKPGLYRLLFKDGRVAGFDYMPFPGGM